MDAANAVECRSHSELYRSKPQASASCWDVPLARLAASFLWDEKKRMVISNIIVEKDNKSFGYGTSHSTADRPYWRSQ